MEACLPGQEPSCPHTPHCAVHQTLCQPPRAGGSQVLWKQISYMAFNAIFCVIQTGFRQNHWKIIARFFPEAPWLSCVSGLYIPQHMLLSTGSPENGSVLGFYFLKMSVAICLS